jgi:hypothetical protein
MVHLCYLPGKNGHFHLYKLHPGEFTVPLRISDPMYKYCYTLGLLEKRTSQQLLKVFIFIYILLSHVSCHVGHLQVEYNYLRKLLHLQRIRCFMLLGRIFIYIWQFLPLVTSSRVNLTPRRTD